MSAINDVTDLTIEDGIAVLTLNSPPVNALSFNVRDGLFAGFHAAIGNDAVEAIVLICEGRTFIAGADISEFGGQSRGASLFDVQSAIEDSPKPIIAAIHGTALGGGLEVALCAHYRIAIPSAKCGLPEVNLGLLPGAGGTQRLPRVVGVPKALEMMTTGQHVPASECLAMGLVDELAGESSLRADAVAFARRVLSEGRPLRKVRDLDARLAEARSTPGLFGEFRTANAKKLRGFKAPESIIQCVEAAVSLPFDDAIAVERKLFAELVTGDQSAAQRYLFFAEREVWKVPDVPADTPVIPIASAAVIGAGTMGGGIAMCFANAGIPVTIIDTTRAALDRGLAVVRANYERSARNGRFTMDEVERRMALLRPSTEMDDLRDADMVIEAVFERMDLKKDIFRRLDAIAKPGAVLATNTSALNIDEIASVTARPEAVIGMHFFSPANVMRLLEIVRADETSIPVINTAMQTAKKIGKIAALVGVCPGFVGNRMLFARTRESNALLDEGSMPWDIDRAVVDFGFAMGPFQMSDLAGLDVGWNAAESKGLTVRERLNEAGRHGQKSGAGYYDYDANRVGSPSPVAEQIVRELAAARGGVPRTASDEEIIERLTLPMINEGARILEEGKAIRASDIDVIWVHGYNWPAYRGGPMFYADLLGLDAVVAKLRQYEQRLGGTWAPARLLVDLAERGKRLRDWKA